MSALLATLRRDLGALGMLAAAVLGLTIAFSYWVIRPLEARKASLELEHRPGSLANGVDLVRTSTRGTAGQLDDFYRFFDRGVRTDEWLAKLYGIGTAAGLQLRQGTYRLDATRGRFERYQILLPVRGSYAQVRVFLETLLAEIPVMSLDQVSFRRRAANDTLVEVEITLTLHLAKK